MGRLLTVSVVAALVISSLPVRAQGPLARAGLHEGLALGSASTGSQEGKRLPESASAVAAATRRLPAGKPIRVTTVAGKTIKGVLAAAGDTSLFLERREGRVEVAYEDIKSIEQGSGMSGAVKAAIIAGVVVGGLAVAGCLMAAADSGGSRVWCQ